MTLLAELLSTIFERREHNSQDGELDTRPIEELSDELVGTAGDASELALSRAVLGKYAALDDPGKLAFFKYLATSMDIDPMSVREALEAHEANPSYFSYHAFMQATEPQRQELVRRLNRVPGATASLVQMREDLLRCRQSDSALSALDLDFQHLFKSWFNHGFLVLKPITWESPAHILEKIIAYEAVHAIDSWEDLRRRLEPSDRRCFAFFHPSMPNDPLIFVEVALSQGTPTSIQRLLAGSRKEIASEEADTAAFYSISNCQPGLAKISFGNFLIKQVVSLLSAELPKLSTFVTLSPVPRLAKWLSLSSADEFLCEADQAAQLAAYYLLTAKSDDGFPFDPVARFHLGNGAEVLAVHAAADASDKGRDQSGGAMVNYVYRSNAVAENHDSFAKTKTVLASKEVHQMAEAGATLLN